MWYAKPHNLKFLLMSITTLPQKPQKGALVIVGAYTAEELGQAIESTGHRLQAQDKKDLKNLSPPDKDK